MRVLQTFEPDVSSVKLHEAITEQGYAVVKNLLPKAELTELSEQLNPHLDLVELGDPDPFFGHRTKRFGALLSRCPITRRMLTNQLILDTADLVLGPYCVRYQVNYTGVMHLAPGETAQTMHRDTGFYPIQNPSPPLTLATMWAVTDFTEENGATRIVPGSHRWTDDRTPKVAEIVQADMPAGSVLIYNGSLLHGGGANESDRDRCGVALHYSLGWLRQEENQYLAISMEEARAFPEKVQRLMGYDLATVNLGFADHKHPNDILNGNAGNQVGTLGNKKMMEADNAVRRFRVIGTDSVGRARIDI
ncbi:MAG: hypothetical protein CMK56_01200 [Proteobacteria bacterium]|nr:hypothetical protein [Pseudomonadota bacterium]